MNEATQRSRLVEGQDEQVAERRFSNTAVVSEAKAERAEQSLIAQAGIRPNHQKLVKMITNYILCNLQRISWSRE